jgi:hypothetical protein
MSKEALSEFKSILKAVGVDGYAEPVVNDTTIVVLGRLKPMTTKDTNLKLAESRLLGWIERSLRAVRDNKDFKVRFSRPWLLKEDQLVFTWDFTLQGDLDKAVAILKEIPIPRAPAGTESIEDTPNRVKPKRGSVTQVRIGAMG